MKQNYQWQQPSIEEIKYDLQRRKNLIELEVYKEQNSSDPKIWLQNKRRSRKYEQGKGKQFPKHYLLYKSKQQKIGQQKNEEWNKKKEKTLQDEKNTIQNKRLQEQKKIKQNPALVRKIKQSQLRLLQKDNEIKSILFQNSNLRVQIQSLTKQLKQVNSYCHLLKQQLRRLHSEMKNKITQSSDFGYEEYRKLIDFAKTTKQWLPSDRNQLSNRIKLQKFQHQYLNYQKRSEKTIEQFQQLMIKKEYQLQELKKHNKILEVNLQKMTELKNLQRNQNRKRKVVIEEHEKQINELIQHNKKISQELEKYYKNSNTTQKSGFIIHKKDNLTS